ncbi:MtN3 and saliva related transmembrane protein [Sphaerotilus hippei]|uniref:MtN3 and saliva related transmembrane protein n=1 Tax=Sphaerotilus hippei TaxID=744406 RepID=A0A318H2U7_9BURK|nr:SemiSWEET transporter [Sphaerotilus hippei]PXW95876.1 MtN3 and saliva related transmembrane protein [Sphaerotilus hippei]
MNVDTLQDLADGRAVDTIGTVAAVLTTMSFVPQAWLTLRTRDVSGISLSMYSAFTVGVALWLIYGCLLGAWPVIIANLLTLTLAASILGMKLWFGRTALPALARSGPMCPGDRA